MLSVYYKVIVTCKLKNKKTENKKIEIEPQFEWKARQWAEDNGSHAEQILPNHSKPCYCLPLSENYYNYTANLKYLKNRFDKLKWSFKWLTLTLAMSTICCSESLCRIVLFAIMLRMNGYWQKLKLNQRIADITAANHKHRWYIMLFTVYHSQYTVAESFTYHPGAFGSCHA